MDLTLFCCIFAALFLQQDVLAASATVSAKPGLSPKITERMESEIKDQANSLKKEVEKAAESGVNAGTAFAESSASAGNGIASEVEHQVLQTSSGSGDVHAEANSHASAGAQQLPLPDPSANIQYPTGVYSNNPNPTGVYSNNPNPTSVYSNYPNPSGVYSNYLNPSGYPNYATNSNPLAGYVQGATNGAIDYADQSSGRANQWLGYGVDRFGNYIDGRAAAQFGARPGYQAAGNGLWQNGESARQQAISNIRNPPFYPNQVYSYYYPEVNRQASNAVGYAPTQTYPYYQGQPGQQGYSYQYAYQYPTGGAQIYTGAQASV